ncbi:MAG: hypothetical protein LBH70_10640 [Spirochaetaceae bacterium]|nr:hypothetical protein [Spirochaetaceae bacterium]
MSAPQVKEKLDTVLDEAQDTFEPVIIAGKNSSAVQVVFMRTGTADCADKTG